MIVRSRSGLLSSTLLLLMLMLVLVLGMPGMGISRWRSLRSSGHGKHERQGAK